MYTNFPFYEFHVEVKEIEINSLKFNLKLSIFLACVGNYLIPNGRKKKKKKKEEEEEEEVNLEKA